ncbi:beta-N-acetylhexosaminidase [Thermosulfuriphilus sp.]
MGPELIRSVAGLFVVGIRGEELSHDERRGIQEYGFRNFILFSRNLTSAEQGHLLVQALKESCLASDQELPLIMVDEEGGPVQRLKEICGPIPSAHQLGHGPRPEQTIRLVATQRAACLRRMGINMNLAPVLDLATQGAVSFIYQRSFGRDPAWVGRLTRIYIKTMTKEGLATCAKHFPGLGEANLDPHQELPKAYVSRETLISRELEPFRQAIAASVPAIMTSHVIYPAIDPEQPATFSRKIVSILRKGLGFSGLLLSDDLEMGAIARNYSLAEAAEGAFYVGHDLLLVCHRLERAIEAVELIAQDLSQGEIPLIRLKEALYRQSALKAWLASRGGL